jgi:hypothetical protein
MAFSPIQFEEIITGRRPRNPASGSDPYSTSSNPVRQNSTGEWLLLEQKSFSQQIAFPNPSVFSLELNERIDWSEVLPYF